MFVGFVIQLSVNSITPPTPRGLLEYIDIHSKQTDCAHSIPEVIHQSWTQTLTSSSVKNTDIGLHSCTEILCHTIGGKKKHPLSLMSLNTG